MGLYTVVISGASGSAYGMRLVEQLVLLGHETTLLMTDAGQDVAAYELDFRMPVDEPAEATRRFLELPADAPLRVARSTDMFDSLASGSHRIDGMVVAPASMGFCASVANGLASDLPERSADVMLKERRPLVLVPRETPLSLIHLRNLTRLAEAGAIVLPAAPAYYHRPRTIDDQISFVVGKILDVLDIEHNLFRRWGS